MSVQTRAITDMDDDASMSSMGGGRWRRRPLTATPFGPDNLGRGSGEMSMKPLARSILIAAGLGLSALPHGPSLGQTPVLQLYAAPGEQVFAARCAGCHVDPKDRAPPKASLAGMGPNAVAQALNTGIMQPMAAGLTPSDIASIALYLTGRAPDAGASGAQPVVNRCPKADPISLSPAWNGWSPDTANTRLQLNSGIRAADVPNLKVKWTFAYAGSKNTQVTIAGDRLCVGSSAGAVYSLNSKTGCTYWRFDAANSVRAAPVVGRMAASPSGYAVYISDFSQTVHALDAMTGKVIWSTAKLDDHPRAMLTGAAKLYRGVLYVPVSSSEEVSVTSPGYICCSFRGSVVALNAATGRQIWKTYTIPEAPHTYRPGQPQSSLCDHGRLLHRRRHPPRRRRGGHGPEDRRCEMVDPGDPERQLGRRLPRSWNCRKLPDTARSGP